MPKQLSEDWWPFFSRTFNTVFWIGLSSIPMYLWWNQRQLIYPANVPEGSREFVDNPSDFGMSESLWKEIWLETGDLGTEKIHMYHLRHSSAEPRDTLIYCHANAGNMGHRLPVAIQIFERFKVNVILFSYRGYGRSDGAEASEITMKQDADSVMKYAIDEHSKDTEFSRRIIVFGQSIGGAVAVYLAHEYQNVVDGLILENTFTSLKELVPRVMRWLPPLLVRFLLTEVWDSDRLCLELASSERSSKQSRLRSVLFLAAGQDEIVPIDLQRKLYNLIPFSEYENVSDNGLSSISPVKKWHLINQSTHNDSPMFEEYWDGLHSYFKLFYAN